MFGKNTGYYGLFGILLHFFASESMKITKI